MAQRKMLDLTQSIDDSTDRSRRPARPKLDLSEPIEDSSRRLARPKLDLSEPIDDTAERGTGPKRPELDRSQPIDSTTERDTGPKGPKLDRSQPIDDTIERDTGPRGTELDLGQSINEVPSEERHRVRRVIATLDFTELRKDMKLPSFGMFTGVPVKGGKFPTVVSKLGYSWFGFFVDYLIRRVLVQRSQLTEDDLRATYGELVSHYQPEEPVSIERILRDFDYYQDIATFVLTNFSDSRSIEVEPEWGFGKIKGHPDLIIDGTIYDIKMTGMFGKMRTQTVLQVLAYYCLAHKTGQKGITHVGLILPAQNLIVRHSLEGWNWRPFWRALEQSVERIERGPVEEPFIGEEEMDTSDELLELYSKIDPALLGIRSHEEIVVAFSLIYGAIGWHTSKVKGSIYESLKQYDFSAPNGYGIESKPAQIFLSGPRQGKVSVKERDITRSRQFLDETGYSLFVHAPYVINLCRRETDRSESNHAPVTLTSNQLTHARRIGCKGVVIHLGHQVKLKYDEALSQMRDNIEKIAANATSECPLLLETGSGTEMLSDIDQFIAFYFSLSEETRRVVGVCFDSCHVFAAGYQPVKAFEAFIRNRVPVKLIHFNDSKGQLGSRKDLHGFFGPFLKTGVIPMYQLYRLALYGVTLMIPMVYES
jgi:deoxyribonuclease-4